MFHPAYIMRVEGMKPVAQRDFKRLPSLHEELKQDDINVTDYRVYPPEEHDEIDDRSTLVIDLEHKGMQPDDPGAQLVCVGVSHRPGSAHIYAPDDPRALASLKADLIIGQNWTLHDAWWIWRKYGIGFNRVWDTRFAGHLLNPDTPNDLVYLAGEFATPPMRGYWKSANDYKEHIEQVCAIDVDATYRVKVGQKDALEAKGQLHIMEDDVIPMCSIVFDIRREGMRIDKKEMDKEHRRLGSEIGRERANLPWEGTEDQPKEVIRHLYQNLKLPVLTDRDSGKPTSKRQALNDLQNMLLEHDKRTEHLSTTERDAAALFIGRITNLREMSKLANTFLKQRVSGRDTVHPILNPGGTTTLRLSCSDPNAQNIPKAARRIFLPDHDGHMIFRADIKQAEVVGLLWFAQQWGVLKRILDEGLDAHMVVASLMEGCSIDVVSKEQRTWAKNSTFAIQYGEHPETTAARTGLSLQDVLDIRKRYFEILPGVEDYRYNVIGEAMSKGYVTSPFAVRRYIRPTRPIGRAANQAANAPIQNIPAMVTRRAMVRLRDTLPDEARLWMQVHDEVNVTGPPRKEIGECLYEVMREGLPEMMTPWGPLKFGVSVEWGPNWGDLKEFSIAQD
jgi:DNA polymerase-1